MSKKATVSEEWRNLDYLPKSIQVSNLGRVRHWDNYFSLGTIIEPSWVDNQLKIYIKNHAYSVHRLVADAFIPNPDKFRFVLHKDKDHNNNNMSNLEWSARSVKERRIRTVSRRIFCPELNKVFGTIETISIVTKLPLHSVTKAIKHKQKICGLTFIVLKNSDYRLKDREVLHVTKEDFHKIAKMSDCVEECYSKLWEYLGEEILVP